MKIYQNIYEARPAPIRKEWLSEIYNEFLENLNSTFSFSLNNERDVQLLKQYFQKPIRDRKDFYKRNIDLDLFSPGPKWESVILNSPVLEIPVIKFNGEKDLVKVFIGLKKDKGLSGGYIKKSSIILLFVGFDQNVESMISECKKMKNILLHELVHAHDVNLFDSTLKLEKSEYFNLKEEVKAYLSQICQKNEQKVLELLGQKKSPKEIIEKVFKKDKIYTHLEKFLTQENKNYFLKGFYTFIQDQENKL